MREDRLKQLEDEEAKRHKTLDQSPTTDAEVDQDAKDDGTGGRDPAAPAPPASGSDDRDTAAPASSMATCLMSLKQSESLFDQLPLMPEDSGMYAILDECCNNSVHGLRWHSRARVFLE
jgi:hypothetical protein